MRWEYFIHFVPAQFNARDLQQALRKIGKDGWEMVGVVFHPPANGMIYHFKRPLSE
jgi:hypothetical protein